MADFVLDSKEVKTKVKLLEFIATLDGEWIVKVKKRKGGRSVQENKYYWGVVISYISEFTGHEPSYLHEYYKYKFIPAVKFTDVSRLTTSDMTSQELWAYMDLIRLDVWLLFDLSIPDPDGVIL